MNKAIADMSTKEKATYFGRMVWSELPIITDVRDLLDLTRMAQGTSLGGKVSLIHGPNGVGKSVACDHYFRTIAHAEGGQYLGTAAEFGNDDSILDATWITTSVGNQERRNFVKIDVSPRVTANGLLADMIRGLTLSEPPLAARHDALLRTVKKVLAGFGTEVLILDNAHRSVERNISIGKSDAGDIIAEVASKTGVEVVLVGTDLSTSLFQDSNKLGNIKRFDLQVAPLPMPANGAQEFLTLLTKFQRRLPFTRRSDLTSDDVATRLYAFCGGNIERLAVFLQSAVLFALKDGAEFIDLGSLAVAYDRLGMGAASKPNPFMERQSPTLRNGSVSEARQ